MTQVYFTTENTERTETVEAGTTFSVYFGYERGG